MDLKEIITFISHDANRNSAQCTAWVMIVPICEWENSGMDIRGDTSKFLSDAKHYLPNKAKLLSSWGEISPIPWLLDIHVQHQLACSPRAPASTWRQVGVRLGRKPSFFDLAIFVDEDSSRKCWLIKSTSGDEQYYGLERKAWGWQH